MSGKGKTIDIPSCIEDITPDWVKQVTGHDAIPEDFKVEGDIQAGHGYLSSICRVSYKTRDGEEQHTIVKLLPTDPRFLEIAVVDRADEREIKVYSVLLPDLLKVVPELGENVCKYYYGAVRLEDKTKGVVRASMLVLQDLKPFGYEMMNFSGTESIENINELITFMARLHFAGMGVSIEKGRSLPELYPFMQGIIQDEDWVNQITQLCEESYPDVEKLLKSQGDKFKNIFERVITLKPFTRKIVEKMDENGRKWPCLIHGDVWPPNILITRDSSPLPAKILDWQLLAYRDPCFDISHMLFTTLPREKLTMDNLHRLVKQYYEEIDKLCKDKEELYGRKIERRSWEEFEHFFFTWGVVFSYIVSICCAVCFDKDYDKYVHIFKVLGEESDVTDFLVRECS